MKKLSIKCREEGRGKLSVEKFATLDEASQYIQDRWQGTEYKDGQGHFHTDYCTYELCGFTFADIGKTNWDDGYPEFEFNAVAVS